jgi:Amt family ammonium transporter
MGALFIGLVAGVLCYCAVMLKGKFGYDDSLDVVGVHCVGGTLGALATGLLATTAVNAGGANGLFYGNPKQLAIQALAVVVTLVYSFGVSFLILKVLDKTMGLRVEKEDEVMGLDLSVHGEAGYTW